MIFTNVFAVWVAIVDSNDTSFFALSFSSIKSTDTLRERESIITTCLDCLIHPRPVSKKGSSSSSSVYSADINVIMLTTQEQGGSLSTRKSRINSTHTSPKKEAWRMKEGTFVTRDVTDEVTNT